MVVLVLAMYLAIAAVGPALLWMAFQIRFRRRLTFIRAEGQDAARLAKGYSTMVATVGVACIALVVAIPVLGLRWGTWHFYLGFLAGMAGIWHNVLIWRARRESSDSK